ncbi:hypothetical protein MMAD_36370 [Mycolicibacterium madagascariense]|uniref:Uncharacterized protein n=1 Tax=Mycolicibacterium madagascariense TaxID=212765 RepID=A0A7I7XJF3_9MYCO|nr:hypothetical protein [Mycolicibacterium madagascariense]MCV7015868.1 hypothetical protein [Mycolicibacterium madagascariense]BBZ29342.1 hypothetical protein MMAD_36370 [Mycolicibacterium madagascariense]
MTSLSERLTSALGAVTTLVEEADGAFTVSVDGMVASLRIVTIGEGLEMVSLTQPLAWDLVLNNKIRERVAELAGRTMLGTVALVEKAADAPTAPANGSTAKSTRKPASKRIADVMLRYNFPAAGLTEDALRTLILLVLTTGADVRRSLTE